MHKVAQRPSERRSPEVITNYEKNNFSNVYFLLCKAVTAEATSPMTPKGFSGVTWRSMSVVVVTALVLMDTVATDVGEDDCF